MPTRTTSSDSTHAITTITMLHGVGMSPSLFDGVVAELVPMCSVHAVTRRGYDGMSSPAATFEEMLDDVGSIVDRVAPTLVVGLSGGATLALAAALSSMNGVVGVVAHEPLLGPLAPDLHRLVADSAEHLVSDSAEGTSAAAAAFVERLVGSPIWMQLPEAARRFAHDHALAVIAEVPLFRAFAPAAVDIEALRVPIVVTTGARSAPARHDASRVLVELAGATARTVDDASHLAPWEQPSRFASIVREALRSIEHPGATHEDHQ